MKKIIIALIMLCAPSLTMANTADKFRWIGIVPPMTSILSSFVEIESKNLQQQLMEKLHLTIDEAKSEKYSNQFGEVKVVIINI